MGRDAGGPAGSIPACAGEPTRCSTGSPAPGVYPRVCGGTSFREDPNTPIEGLSPRVRGNPRGRTGSGAHGGSIPACAGEPASPHDLRQPAGVYPRVCGGTCPATALNAKVVGLSPRVRGNPSEVDLEGERVGSIPACAGEPLRAFIRRPPSRVYPRVCGGTARPALHRESPGGLSPRVRGNLRNPGVPEHPAGSIPACAGEPGSSAGSRCPCWVYPRVCGGTAPPTGPPPRSRGLSPRVRGNLNEQHPHPDGLGSIPACAGEPRAHFLTLVTGRVYPRVCGGTSATFTNPKPLRGLSPRVRGNRHGGSALARWAGSIPACAGEPSPA